MNKRPIPSDADSAERSKRRIKASGLACPLDLHRVEVATSANGANRVLGSFSLETKKATASKLSTADESTKKQQQATKMNTARLATSKKEESHPITLSSAAPIPPDNITSPQSFLHQRFGINSISSSLSVDNFFIRHTEEQIKAYDVQVIQAVRSQDIDQLRRMHKAGRQLQCANKFGESLVHMACRRGFVDVVRFLVDEAGVSVRVRDDYGRTALHDACWTSEPNEELVEYLIRQCPELLLMSDKRGNAPFEYVRREHWGQWLKFVREMKSCS